MIRPPEYLVLSNGVFVTARVAAYLLRYAELERYRISHRGEDPEVDSTLVALTVAALEWRSSATGTKDAARPELDTSLEWLGTRAAATQLGVTDSAIRKAIRERRLKAEKIGSVYRINREQLAHFKQNRSANN